jgi:hypothetical protein
MNENIRIIFGILIILLLYLNITNTVHKKNFENFSSELDENKSLIDKYLEYNKNIYEYIFNTKIPDKINNSNNFKSVTLTDYYNNIYKTFKEYYNDNKTYNNKECGYIYKYYDEESLLPGSLYLTDDEIIININDLNNNNIVSVLENNNILVISNKLITYRYDIKYFDVDNSKGIITIYIDQNKNNDSFFDTNNKYIIYPCANDILEHIESTNNVKIYIDNNNIGRTIIYFVCLFIIVFLIYNWKFFYYTFNNYFSRKTNIESNNDELSYVYTGGYDYKDYSE